MSESKHNIQKMVFEIKSIQQKHAYEIQNEIASICEGFLLKEIDALFTKYDHEHLTIRIDRIEIDLGEITKDELQETLIRKIRTELEKILQQLKKQDRLNRNESTENSAYVLNHLADFTTECGKAQGLKIITERQQSWELFIHFIIKGYFPWWATHEVEFDVLEKEIVTLCRKQPSRLNELQNLLVKDPWYVSRLVNESSEPFVEYIFTHVLGSDSFYRAYYILIKYFERVFVRSKTFRKHVFAHYWFELLNYLQGSKRTKYVQAEVWLFRQLCKKYRKNVKLVLHKLQSNQTDWEKLLDQEHEDVKYQLNSLFKRIAREEPGKDDDSLQKSNKHPMLSQVDKDEVSREEEVKTNDFTNEKEDIYTGYAGLVVLHPFYKELFVACGLLKTNDFVNKRARQKALRLLDYIATGNVAQSAEFDLVLHKLICGISLSSPLGEFVEISAPEREQADQLISAAIAHWSALKNTSIDGFREAFLKRKGKLQRVGDNWLLQVDKQPYDVLLDKLPWNLAMLKQPWNKYLLNVEWY